MQRIASTIRHGRMKKIMQIFGKCNNPNYHGHNYELIVTALPATRILRPDIVFDMKVLSDLIRENVFLTI